MAKSAGIEQKRARTEQARRKMPIEAALAWAWKEELPKREAGGGRWLPVAGYGDPWGAITELGVKVSSSGINQFGCAIDFVSEGEPHRDALTLGNGVRDLLSTHQFEALAGFNPVPELTGQGGDMQRLAEKCIADVMARRTLHGKDGVARLNIPPAGLVVRHAILGGAPDWEMEMPRLDLARHSDGRPRFFVKRRMPVAAGVDERGNDRVVMRDVEVEGMTARGRPMAGAYRKHRLLPDPAAAILCRIEYHVWWRALNLLACVLADKIETFDLMPPAAEDEPWLQAVVARAPMGHSGIKSAQ